jgi:DNA invertase Pin-like site-specific DNA recombinase
MHLLQIAQLSRKQGWRLIITSANVDTNTAAGAAFITMAAAFAQYESEMISARVKRQHQARRERGEVWGVNSGVVSKLPTETRELIVKLRTAGLSLEKIAQHLTANNIHTPSGRKWSHGTINQILKSPLTKALAA